ncbi:TetR/AcrR family transcriptional regulator [Nocardia harenae]|uniref:TetR/AcrR family transcriptional regulator n=1 Tax=Nocardia harenae TaxID=358707 RepID=UPI00082D1150|nr:TetR/AcrR family transcriptional regulator [Nocardia harenae]
MNARARTDRRAPQRGDLRRSALLGALAELLKDSGGNLDPITIAEISKRAGLTRSAFYFYFENKAAAVAATLEEMYDEVFAVTDVLVGPGDPALRIEHTARSLVEFSERHRHLFRAALEARNASPEVRRMWEADRQAFIPAIAAMIDGERAAGRAPDGADATALADVLLLLNERLLERLTLGDGLDRENYVDAVVTVWLRTVYGRVPADRGSS